MATNFSRDRNRIRIIGGQWRSRLISFSNTQDLRPTPDRVRETLFNWLQLRITGAHCLDLFAGSGVLGLEAISRGAAGVTAIELDTAAARCIKQAASVLDTDRLKVIQENATTWLTRKCSGHRYDVVFLDPPYASQLQAGSCKLLAEGGWLNPGALVYIEAAEPLETIILPEGWKLTHSKRAAEVCYGLCQTKG